MPLHHYIFYCMMGIEILFLIPFTLNYRHLKKEHRLIYLYLVSCAIYAVGSNLVAKLYGNNMIFITITYLVQFIILSLFYIHVFKSPTTRKVLKIIMVFATLLFAADLLLLEGVEQFNSIFISFRDFALIVYGVMFFLQLMRDEELIEQSIFINSLPVFWFNAGLFVNFCCYFLLDLSFNFIQRAGPSEVMRSIYQITAALTWTAGIIQVILFYIGLVKIKRARA